MDLEIVILSEVSQRKINIIGYPLYVESKEMVQMNLFTKQKLSHRHKKKNLWLPGGIIRGGINWEIGNIHTTIYRIDN